MSSPTARMEGCGAWREHMGRQGSCRAARIREGEAPAEPKPTTGTRLGRSLALPAAWGADRKRPRRRAAARCAATNRHALAVRLGMKFRQSSAQAKKSGPPGGNAPHSRGDSPEKQALFRASSGER